MYGEQFDALRTSLRLCIKINVISADELHTCNSMEIPKKKKIKQIISSR